ncbi:MAG: proliferating cell nuclear antigen (pcna) [Nanoarchaeota archaeon]
MSQPQYLSDVVSIISDIVSEVKFKITEDGVGLTALDPANVAMVSFFIPKTSFSHYESNNEILGLSLESLKQVLRRCRSGSNLILETEDNLLKIQILDKIKRNFTLSLIDINAEEKELPNLEFSSKIDLDSGDFVSSIEDCSIVSDACSFSIKEGKFFIEARGLNSAMSEFSSDEAKIEAEDCRAKYSLEYLQKFVKAAKLSARTIVKFANDYPLRIDYRNEKVELSFILAPRVESED